MSDDFPLQVGDKAPDFKIASDCGAVVDLSEYSGSWVVLYFYPRDNTSGCTKEAVEFSELLPKFEALNAKVVGVSKDSVKSHQNFRQKHDLKVELLSDPDLEVLKSYGAWRMKKMYGKESMGTVRSTVLIDPDGVVRHIWPKVAKGAGHAEKVLEELEKIAQG